MSRSPLFGKKYYFLSFKKKFALENMDDRHYAINHEFFALFSGIAINLYNKSAYHSGIFPSVVSAFTFFNNSAYSAVLSLMESAVLSLAVSAVLSEDVSEASELSLVSSALLSLDVLVSLR